MDACLCSTVSSVTCNQAQLDGSFSMNQEFLSALKPDWDGSEHGCQVDIFLFCSSLTSNSISLKDLFFKVVKFMS